MEFPSAVHVVGEQPVAVALPLPPLGAASAPSGALRTVPSAHVGGTPSAHPSGGAAASEPSLHTGRAPSAQGDCAYARGATATSNSSIYRRSEPIVQWGKRELEIEGVG